MSLSGSGHQNDGIPERGSSGYINNNAGDQ